MIINDSTRNQDKDNVCYVRWGKGISKTGEIIDIGVEHEIIKKSGSWFSYGDTKLGQGRDAVKGLIDDNPELKEELEGKIRNAMNGVEEPVAKTEKTSKSK